MDEQAIRAILEGVIKSVMEQQGGGLQDVVTPECPHAGGGAIPVELSARHIHLSERDATALFGGPLTFVKELSQPGEFLCRERVRLVGPKGVIDNVAVLGPARKVSQVEISRTDARTLGADAPVRRSGDVEGTPGIILTSGNNMVALDKGLIVAARHIHMTPEDARIYRVADRDMVNVRIGGSRPVVLEDVLVRVNPDFRLVMHIDSDEGNGSGWDKGVSANIVAGKNRQGPAPDTARDAPP
jgi:propanediol utilization protein